MRLEQGKISSSQLVFIVLGVILSSVQVIPPSGRVGRIAWLTNLIGVIEACGFALIFIALAKRFQGDTFVDIASKVWGTYLGKAVSGAYLLFLFHIGSLVIDDFATFLNTVFMPETPSVVLALGMAAVAAYTVRHGIEVIARCSQILVPMLVVNTALAFLLALPQFELANLQPLFDAPLSELALGAHRATAFPYLESLAFLMVFPFVSRQKQVGKSVIGSLIIGGVFLSFLSVRNYAISGIVNTINVYPSVMAIALIEVGEIVTRIEALVALNMLSVAFLAICVFMYTNVLGTAQLLELNSYRPLVIPTAVLMALVSTIHFENYIEAFVFANQTSLLYHPIFEIIVPGLTLLVAAARGKRNTGRDALVSKEES